MPSLLTLEAIKYLERNNYSSKNHEERMALIKKARELYPDTEEEIEAE